jgi:hypothetical protein
MGTKIKTDLFLGLGVLELDRGVEIAIFGKFDAKNSVVLSIF